MQKCRTETKRELLLQLLKKGGMDKIDYGKKYNHEVFRTETEGEVWTDSLVPVDTPESYLAGSFPYVFFLPQKLLRSMSPRTEKYIF